MWLSRTRFSPDGLGRERGPMHEMDRFKDRESVLRTSEAREERALGAAVSRDSKISVRYLEHLSNSFV